MAGLALADGGVQSANTVGFQDNTTVAGFNWYSPPFATVGQTTATYGDILLEGENVTDYTDNIQVLDEEGGPAAQFYWVGNGWFDMDGYVSGDYMTDEVIARGTSFIVYTENADATIRCSGEVATNKITFAEASVAGFNWVGNPFPKEITYGDIAISGDNVTDYTDNIQLLDEEGGPSAQFYWVGTGWFDMDGYVTGDFMTDETIDAGAGFLVYTENSDVTIEINGLTL